MASSEEDIVNIIPSECDPIKALYPRVIEADTPLPRCWSGQDKYNSIGLSQNNLRVHYKGFGKTHKDAASVKANHHIPASCGLYYYEVKIVSKGRDGYMGIGLSTQGVSMNRLPGWEKNSYGYHGDDGHSFCSSGSGQPYGPTFTTGDVIGCGINLIDNICFYTKNGEDLGVAFTDLPAFLYPTVGLQTPGEVVDANFGQTPFVFDFKGKVEELKNRIRGSISNFSIADTFAESQILMYKMISTYLVHHGYCATAEEFAKSTSQELDEEVSSMRKRQKIQKMVLAGKLGQAIKTVKEEYPGLLENNLDLLFMLRVRHFIEIVNGTVTDANISCTNESKTSHSYSRSHSQSPSAPVTNGKAQPTVHVQHTSVIQSTKNILSRETEELNERNAQESAKYNSSPNGTAIIIPPPPIHPDSRTSSNSVSTSSSSQNDSDVEMDNVDASIDDCDDTNCYTNGFSKDTDCYMNDSTECEQMEIENGSSTRKMCGGDRSTVDKMLLLGRELQQMSQTLKREYSKNGKNKQNQIMLQNAFSLLAYNDPWNSKVGWQLNPVQREPVCQALNSAILESFNLPKRPPLETCISHTKQLMSYMANSGISVCAFTNFDTIAGSSPLHLQKQ